MKNIIEIRNLKASYGEIKAVDNISFNVKEGELFALLGKNGAGKSTTINVLCTLKEKDRGTVTINGFDIDKFPDKVKQEIGVVFQNSVLDPLLTVDENLRTRAALYHLSKKDYENRLSYLVEKLELQDILNRKYRDLSGGQKRKVDIARALINNPKILFLDEPTTGLDPQIRIKVWEILNDIKEKENTTIILTTHYMEETKHVDTVVIIDKGRILENGTPSYLKDKYAFDSLKLYYKENMKKELIKGLRDLKFSEETDCLEIRVDKNMDVLSLLNDINPFINSFELIKGDMDTVFINVTGGKQLLGGDENEK
ncbi:TPA: ABC transporter ATP-binding protein [bacterium]|jgi:ABC-type multidrug transport system ATPase subunit|nr:ABC transporter ATP-binding protein [bacterium]